MDDRLPADAGGPLSMPDVADGWPSLGPAAARLGAYRWFELRLFELTGSWASADGLSPQSRMHLFEASAQHGWHAELWGDRLPVLAGVDQDALTRPGGPLPTRMVEALEQASWPDGSGEAVAELAALEVLYRVVVPHLVASYRAHLEGAVPVAEGPTSRALLLVLRDEEAQLVAGRALLDELAASAHDAAIEWAAQSVADALEVVGDLETGGGRPAGR